MKQLQPCITCQNVIICHVDLIGHCCCLCLLHQMHGFCLVLQTPIDEDENPVLDQRNVLQCVVLPILLHWHTLQNPTWEGIAVICVFQQTVSANTSCGRPPIYSNIAHSGRMVVSGRSSLNMVLAIRVSQESPARWEISEAGRGSIFGIWRTFGNEKRPSINVAWVQKYCSGLVLYAVTVGETNLMQPMVDTKSSKTQTKVTQKIDLRWCRES